MGKAIAIEFAKEGAKVIVADLNLDGAKDNGSIKEYGSGSVSVKVDVGSPQEIDAMMNQVLRCLKRSM
ncbi:MAG: SDR family oxidoreductase [Christensenellales bacterium]